MCPVAARRKGMKSRLLVAFASLAIVAVGVETACSIETTDSGAPPVSVGDAGASNDAGSDGRVDEVDGATADAAPTWTPKNLTSLALWLDADKGVTAAANKVSAWADQSGSGQDATTNVDDAGFTCNPPALSKAAVKGHDVLHFSGESANECLTNRAASALAFGGADFLVELVVRQEGGGMFEGQMWLQTGASNGSQTIMYGAADNPEIDIFTQMQQTDAVTFSRASSTNKYVPGGFHVVGTRRRGDNLEVRVDGVATPGEEAQLGMLPFPAPQAFTIGHATPADFNARMLGDIAEIVVVKAPSEADIASLEGYFKAKFGL